MPPLPSAAAPHRAWRISARRHGSVPGRAATARRGTQLSASSRRRVGSAARIRRRESSGEPALHLARCRRAFVTRSCTNKKTSTRLAFLLRCACRLRFASAAQAETGEAEAQESQSAGFGDGSRDRAEGCRANGKIGGTDPKGAGCGGNVLLKRGRNARYRADRRTKRVCEEIGTVCVENGCESIGIHNTGTPDSDAAVLIRAYLKTA